MELTWTIHVCYGNQNLELDLDFLFFWIHDSGPMVLLQKHTSIGVEGEKICAMKINLEHNCH